MPNGCCHRLSSLDVMIGRPIPLSTEVRAGCGIDSNNKRRKPVYTEIQFAQSISMTVRVCVLPGRNSPNGPRPQHCRGFMIELRHTFSFIHLFIFHRSYRCGNCHQIKYKQLSSIGIDKYQLHTNTISDRNPCHHGT